MSAAVMLPHQVDIFYNFNLDGASQSPVCAGTIISSYFVLTLASCVLGKNQSALRIRASGNDGTESQIRMIDQVYSYPALKNDPSSQDIALLHLGSELELDGVWTKALPLASKNLDSDNFSCRAPLCRSENSMSHVKRINCSELSPLAEGTQEQNSICTEPLKAVTMDKSCQLPLDGSGLVCSKLGEPDFLYGALSLESPNLKTSRGKRMYTNISPYSHWIQLISDPKDDSAEKAEKISISKRIEKENSLEDSIFGLAATSFGGTAVDQNQKVSQFPYQLSIQFNGRHSCGGVILDKKTALSAASCFQSTTSLNIHRYTVVAGEQNLNRNDSTEQIFQIKKVAIHPNYNTKIVFKGSDISVIHINGEFNFNDRVRNVWISSRSTPNYQDLNGTLAGWGKSTSDGSASNVLRSLELEFLEHSRCKKLWSFLTPSMICGYNNFSNTCAGDSGSPLVIKNYQVGPHTKKDLLVGISSFGPRDCEKLDQANGFTNVSHFYQWIAEERSNSLCSSSQFQCFNGECIDEELRCDKNYDCRDGSDEKICQSHTPVKNSSVKPPLSGKKVVDQTKNPVPYQLSLQRDGKHICGAVILDKKTALTVAHCLDRSREWSRFTLVAGEQNLNRNDSTEQVVHLERVFQHPKFRTVLAGNDIAVIHVQGEFNFNDRVKNVWISSRTTPKFQEFTGTATGWGKTTNAGNASNILHSLELEFMEQAVCKKKWTFLTPSTFCGYNNVSNVCAGDTGGPFVIKNYQVGPHTKKDLLVGIPSFGPKDCEAQDTPNGFTNVNKFYDWIAEKRSNSLCSFSQFQCFNGECIDEELRCDKKYDCADGSDEKVCQSHSPVPGDCGGVIELAYSHEIQWRAPTSHSHQNSSCFWFIANPNRNGSTTTQIKILSDPQYQFDNNSTQLYILQNLTRNELSPFFLNETNYEYTFNQPILVLHFRVNPNHNSNTTTGSNNRIRIRIRDKSTPNPFLPKKSRFTISSSQMFSSSGSSKSTPKISTYVYSESSVENKIRIPSQNQNGTMTRQESDDNRNPVESNANNFPYLLQLQRDGQHVCSAMILDKKTAVTPAHCVHKIDVNRNNYTLVAGHHHEEKVNSVHQRQVLQIKRVVKHPNYKNIFTGNDIALIHVQGEFNFTDGVNNVWISTPENTPLNFSDATGTVAAWGAESRQPSSIRFKTFDMEVLTPSACKKDYTFLTESMLCGQRNFTNMCYSSGGPFVMKNYKFESKGNSTRNERDLALGILALGPSECESITKPMVSTRLEYFYKWIEKNRANSLCSPSQFQCFNGQCIARELKCDRVFHCQDGSDEKVCNTNSLALQAEALEVEHLFLIIQPLTNGGRVHLENLQQTVNQDSLQIISYRENTQALTNLNSDRGGGNESTTSYFGDENESVLIYLRAQRHRPNSSESKVMSFYYSERPRVSPSNICGGFLELKDELEIVFQISPEPQSPKAVTCEWTVKNVNGSEIEATLVNNPQLHFPSLGGSLNASINPNFTSSSVVVVKELTAKYHTYTLPYSQVTFTFYSNSSALNAGFHLYLRNPKAQRSSYNQITVKEI